MHYCKFFVLLEFIQSEGNLQVAEEELIEFLTLRTISAIPR